MTPLTTRRQRVRERSRQAVARQAMEQIPLAGNHLRWCVITPEYVVVCSRESRDGARNEADFHANLTGIRCHIVDCWQPSTVLETIHPRSIWFPNRYDPFDRDEMPEKVNWQKEGF